MLSAGPPKFAFVGNECLNAKTCLALHSKIAMKFIEIPVIILSL